MIKCKLRTIWYNIRYFNTFLLNGYLATGHDFEYTGKTHDTHWEMRCKCCSTIAGSDVGPDAKIKEI